MRYGLLAMATLLAVSGGDPAVAYFCEGGQQPVAPAIAAQMALPECGFAATKRWGPNGCQLCDPKNMYPNPFADYGGPPPPGYPGFGYSPPRPAPRNGQR
jgi:hypothetical protein